MVEIRGRIHRLHRLVMDDALGRPLLASEDVHHIDGNRLNNALENLQLLSHASHLSLTNRKYPLVSHCFHCGQPFAKERKRWLRPSGRFFCSRDCYFDWRRALAHSQRHNLPPPQKAPVCPLENLLFQT